MIKHTLWIDSLRLTEVDGSDYIPTMMCYLEKPLYGIDAQEQTKQDKIVNKDFKVKLGDIIPGNLNRETFATESDKELTAYELSKDFFERVLSNIEKKVTPDKETGKLPIKVMIAEPLAFQVENHAKNWIKNYRANIKRILSRYEIVEFLPEPFAVYQFYRYGLRIPQLKDDSKHIALIIDFGGGTFDACIIESTNKGDISITGKHSKPLAAASIPIGGFFINEVIAEYLIKRILEGRDKNKADMILKTYRRVLNGELCITTLNSEKQDFINNFEKLKTNVEQHKIELTNLIQDWELDNETDDYKKIQIYLPSNPFSQGEWKKCDFRAHEFKNIFKNNVWKKLSDTVRTVLNRADDELLDKDITTTLISGGSSNIRWLSELLSEDFKEELKYAKPLPLNTSFQEIVAKGLAIECARRNFEHESEFVSVTYNPVKLLLNPDSKGIEKKKFISIENKIDMSKTKQGDLLPSAQSLVNFIDEPIQWKVKLTHPPKNFLEYFFVRPDTQENDLDCYNVENTKVFTKDNKKFDSQIRIELLIREDGTVNPRFIYKVGNKEQNIPQSAVSGDPFVIDMTYESSSNQIVGNYIGFDFGTSNSSVCELTSNSVKKIENRVSDARWTGLQNLLPSLPYPVALSIRKFLDVNNNNDMATVARDAFEAVLAFAAYTASAEAMSHGLLKNTLKNFQHRSLGPLKNLLEKSLSLLGKKAVFSAGYSSLFTTHKDQFILAIDQFNEHKHDKLQSDQFDAQSHLLMIANVCNSAMKDKLFGFCSHSEPEPYKRSSFHGTFKVAHDVQPFIDAYDYSSSLQYRQDEALLFNKQDSTCLNISPFIIWREIGAYTSPYSCIWFDKMKENDTILKPCDNKEQFLASSISPELVGIYQELISTGLPEYSIIEKISLAIENEE